jgi:hypothetical protein
VTLICIAVSVCHEELHGYPTEYSQVALSIKKAMVEKPMLNLL